jgi:hypothetical protein
MAPLQFSLRSQFASRLRIRAVVVALPLLLAAFVAPIAAAQRLQQGQAPSTAPVARPSDDVSRMIPPPQSDEPDGPIWQYKEKVPLSVGEVRRGDTCVTFSPEMSAGDFFEGLQRLDLPSGSMYRKSKQPVTQFPTYIEVLVYVDSHQCDADLYTSAKAPDFLSKIKFRLQWKRELDMRPADFTLEQVPLNLDEGDYRLLFIMRIKDENVPLTDHLILSVWNEQGKLLSRMSARL